MSQFDTSGNPYYSGSGGGPGGGSSEAINQLNSLLRGELSAIETYRQALNSVDESDQVTMDHLSIIREIQAEHESACDLLRQRITELGGEPAESSGAWGAWAQFVQGTANLFGDTSSLKSLKEGEEHGLKDYEEALDDVDVLSRQVFTTQLIPAQQRHIGLLNQLIGIVGNA